jgi:hypothetical protein
MLFPKVALAKLQSPVAFDTVLSMEWKIFKSTSPEEKNENLWTLFNYYKHQKIYNKCLQALNRFDVESWKQNPTSKNLVIQEGLIYYLLGKPGLSIKKLIPIENENLSADDHRLLYYILAQSLIDEGEFLVSRSKVYAYLNFSTLDSLKKTALKMKYDSLTIAATSIKLKSVSKARNLSLFLPSAGLFYTGNTSKGIKNLSLQIASASYLTYNILIQNYLTAGTFNFHLVRLFYIGGVNQSGYFAKEFNIQKTYEARNKLNNYLPVIFSNP